MATRKAQAVWQGSLKDGQGTMKFGTFEGAFTYASRFEEGTGTNPEELIGAAHAGCFSMSLSSNLGKAGFTPQRIQTQATVYLERVDGKNRITRIHLDCEAQVPGIDNEAFQSIAEAAKSGCPVSAALSAVEITLTARLLTFR
jgi:osmotically inducible protein OsmC